MATIRDVIDSGFFDRLVNRLGSIGAGQIRPTSAAYLRAVRDIRAQSPFDVAGGWGPFREAAEAARLSVNAARRFENTGGTGTAPGPERAPCLDEPGTRCRGSVDYHVIVEYSDPDTGGVNRFPVVITSRVGLTAAQIEARAGAAGRSAENWRTSGQRGQIGPSTALVISTTVLAVVGRS